MADIDDPSDDEGDEVVWQHREVPGMAEKDHDFERHDLCLCGAIVFTRAEMEKVGFNEWLTARLRLRH